MVNRRVTVFSGTDIIDEYEVQYEWPEVRMLRNDELKKTDWWAVKDLTMSQAKKDYSQALRDLPQNFDDPNEALDNWPELPE